MVLEHIFPEDWLENKGRYAFILGIAYSVVGILIAQILFPGDPALVAVALTSMLLLPELYKIFSIEERKESVEKKVSMTTLWRGDLDIVRVYIFLFLGILLTYSAATIALDSLEANTLFREQLEFRYGQGFAGNAVFGSWSSNLFMDLLSNNFLVLMACFVLALLTGDGAIFMITWNASVWGTIFGLTAKNAASFSGENSIYYFILIMLIVFPHMIIEAISYFLAAISGSIISKDVLLENFASERFYEVFTFNLYILLAALVVLVIGAGVETWVLENVSFYQEIIQMSMQVSFN